MININERLTVSSMCGRFNFVPFTEKLRNFSQASPSTRIDCWPGLDEDGAVDLDIGT